MNQIVELNVAETAEVEGAFLPLAIWAAIEIAGVACEIMYLYR